MKKKHVFLASALIAATTLPFFSAFSFAGGEGVGGGFMDFNGRKILTATIAELNKAIPTIQTPSFQAHPERRSVVLVAINSVQIQSSKVRVRGGQSLVMDYDVSRNRIIALKPFFEGFQTAAVTPESIKGASQLILHEAAHLWGDDDVAADQFAEEVLRAIYPSAPADPLALIKTGDYVLVGKSSACTNHLEVDLRTRRVYMTLTGKCKIAGTTMIFQCNRDTASDCRCISGVRKEGLRWFYEQEFNGLSDGNWTYSETWATWDSDRGRWYDVTRYTVKYTPAF